MAYKAKNGKNRFNLKPIRKLLKNLKFLPIKLGRKGSLHAYRQAGWSKFKSFTESRFFNFYGTLALVLLVLVFKGTPEGQTTLFSNLIMGYIEETSASIITITQSQNQLADINSLTALSGQNLGRGGESSTLEPSTVQENSLMASNPTATDYIETGFKSNQIAEYIVQPGDLLSFIASDYGVSVNSIIWANNLVNANSINPDQILRIPPVSGVIHKVKTGDTVTSIAKKYGVTTDKILAFNNRREGQPLDIDEELIVPDGQITSPIVTIKPGKQPTVAKRFSYLPDLGSYFMIPTQGRISQGLHGRNSVDQANSCGTPIYASADGSAATVDANGYNGGFGKFIKLIHPNGTETLYAHASKLLVATGQIVAKGQIIALMGTTGRSTGCHLHFEVHGARNPLLKY